MAAFFYSVYKDTDESRRRGNANAFDHFVALFSTFCRKVLSLKEEVFSSWNSTAKTE
jgi:hypothetical protein